MEVAFSERLKRAIGDEGQHLQKKLGHLSRRFKMRIDQMKAADHYYEYQSIGLGRLIYWTEILKDALRLILRVTTE